MADLFFKIRTYYINNIIYKLLLYTETNDYS